MTTTEDYLHSSPVLVTGGAGFIGVNLALRLLHRGYAVRIFDSLCRRGVSGNLDWLRATHPERLDVMAGDMRDARAVAAAVKGARHVFHLAAQVAVTTSLANPRHDFDVNAGGTINVLEAARSEPGKPGVTFASTNKVYGALNDVPLTVDEDRYLPTEGQLGSRGIDETRPLDFLSPYGCSKGAAEQYVLDYARSYGMSNTVLRMSCIYGPFQQGTSDQGWIAHFIRCALTGEPVTLYGDGRQVRDVLFIDDFTRALERVLELKDSLAGRAFNVGGGVRNAVSLRELIALVEAQLGRPIEVRQDHWRPGDQRYYVSDIGRFAEATGWRPRVSVAAGVRALIQWLRSHETESPAEIPLGLSRERAADRPRVAP